ncbi:MAG: NAD(P)/FAD-dependent oxidoreductase [Lachnospiraceae bacterium]|nr:NAD(P)/FAD-dependent oxidoreductase [Lachnospiraceae bacterium]
MKYVIIGSSAAGINGARELRRLDKDSRIVLVSQDNAVYSRCILHHYLAGKRSLEELSFAEPDFAGKFQVEWIRGRSCVKVKPKEKEIVLDNGEEITYDKLLLASGSHTFLPPVLGLLKAEEGGKVCGFRNIEDMEKLKKAVQNSSHPAENIVVMGAGLVGLDAAIGLLDLGIKVSLVEMADWLLNRQLDKRAAKVYEDALENAGVRQYYGVGIEEVILEKDNQIRGLKLTDGREIPCDYLVVTAGVRPNTGFLEGSGIAVDDHGLVYDEFGQTSDPDIFGAGDISGKSPIWPAAVKEGLIAAANMAGVKREMTDFFASKATMNFLNIPTMALGNVNPAEGEAVEEVLETSDSYKKIVHQNGKIIGAILQGDLDYGGILQQLIARKIDITKVKKPIFSIDYSDFFHIKENFEYFYEDETMSGCS